jgi:CheY-like chemotaxis protein
MLILLIEDDNYKQEQIEEAIRDIIPDATIDVGRSVQQAVSMVNSCAYNLIVLDIALPSHESKAGGAQPISQPSGGVEVLLELSYANRNEKVIIVTQYPEIEYDGRLYPLNKVSEVFSKSLSVKIADVIHFSAKTTNWKPRFQEVLQ